ncbi:MAG: hypothetical protein O6703_11725 [Gammaproteobacteria bacterium]|nr:hypothetical protein [Gammaproteobacteria bacterium]
MNNEAEMTEKRIAIVTGGLQGIGLAVAEGLTMEDIQVNAGALW